MKNSKVDLYLCGVKGFAAAQVIVNSYLKNVGSVTVAPDTGTVDDPIEKLPNCLKETALRSLLKIHRKYLN